MDPEYITKADWNEIGRVLKFLWLFVAFSIAFGANFLLAHAIVPSLVITGHLPQKVLSARRFLYMAALGSLIGVTFAMFNFISGLGILNSFWSRWLI
jgi:hypothetical protein